MVRIGIRVGPKRIRMQGTPANQICPGIGAALCHDVYSALHGVQDDDMNLLVMGSRVVNETLAWQLADAFIQASYVPKEQGFGIPP